MRGNWMRLITVMGSLAALAGAVGLPATLVVGGHVGLPKLSTPPTVSKSVVRALPGATALPRPSKRAARAPRVPARSAPTVARLVSAPLARPESRPVAVPSRPPQPAPAAATPTPSPAPAPAPPAPTPPTASPAELVSATVPVEPAGRRKSSKRHSRAPAAAEPSRVLADAGGDTPSPGEDQADEAQVSNDSGGGDGNDGESAQSGDPGAALSAPQEGGRGKNNGEGKGKQNGKGR